MTINGPAPMLLSFFLNAAIDQQCEKYIKAKGLEKEVRSKIEKAYKSKGMDVPVYKGELPEGNDGLGLMLLGSSGDQVLSEGGIREDQIGNPSGRSWNGTGRHPQGGSGAEHLHFQHRICPAAHGRCAAVFYRPAGPKLLLGFYFGLSHRLGANPITQLAFTLANGFTYVEYYLSRGMDINEFAPNLSFFFSNGIDPEYAVIGRWPVGFGRRP